MQYLDPDKLAAVDAAAFQRRDPYPWVNPEGLLSPAGYQRLLETLPDVSQFTPMFGVVRRHGQQSHDRYALEYRDDLTAVSPEWHEFIRELQGPAYTRFLRRVLGRRFFGLRFHWHYAPNGASISPHCDSNTKIGSHIFYFNTAADWDAAWGGQTMILDDRGRFATKSAPAFEQFARAETAETVGNYSLLFMRRGNSWHGMREIHCPEHAMRRVFIVVVNDMLRTAPRDLARRLLGQPSAGY